MVRTCAMGQMHPTNLLGMEMMVIAAVVLGGTAITGGKGSLTGVMLGTLLIVIVQNSMILMGIKTFPPGRASPWACSSSWEPASPRSRSCAPAATHTRRTTCQRFSHPRASLSSKRTAT